MFSRSEKGAQAEAEDRAKLLDRMRSIQEENAVITVFDSIKARVYQLLGRKRNNSFEKFDTLITDLNSEPLDDAKIRITLNHWVGAYVKSHIDEEENIENIASFNAKDINNFEKTYQLIFDLQVFLAKYYPTSLESPFLCEDLDLEDDNNVPLPNGKVMTKKELREIYVAPPNLDANSPGYKKRNGIHVPCDSNNKPLNPVEDRYLAAFLDRRSLHLYQPQNQPQTRWDYSRNKETLLKSFLRNIRMMPPGFAKTAAIAGGIFGLLGLYTLAIIVPIPLTQLALLYAAAILSSLYNLGKYWHLSESRGQRLGSAIYDILLTSGALSVVSAIFSLTSLGILGFLAAHAISPAAAAVTATGICLAINTFVVPPLLTGLSLLSDALKIRSLNQINIAIMTMPVVLGSKITSTTAMLIESLGKALRRGITYIGNTCRVEPPKQHPEQGAEAAHENPIRKTLSPFPSMSQEDSASGPSNIAPAPDFAHAGRDYSPRFFGASLEEAAHRSSDDVQEEKVIQEADHALYNEQKFSYN